MNTTQLTPIYPIGFTLEEKCRFNFGSDRPDRATIIAVRRYKKSGFKYLLQNEYGTGFSMTEANLQKALKEKQII